VDRLCTLVICGAPLAARAPDIVADLLTAGWRVHVVATPAASAWLDEGAIAAVAGVQPIRHHRSPDESKRGDRPDALVIAPITFNTVGKLAAGIADTYAHSVMCEALGERLPILAVPMVNHQLWGHPAWEANLRWLREAGVTLLDVGSGRVGSVPVRSGTGGEVVERFDPVWITAQLAVLAQAS
jgi:phosphopantothenoylcysteine synthetase/decarboxylase